MQTVLVPENKRYTIYLVTFSAGENSDFSSKHGKGAVSDGQAACFHRDLFSIIGTERANPGTVENRDGGIAAGRDEGPFGMVQILHCLRIDSEEDVIRDLTDK